MSDKTVAELMALARNLEHEAIAHGEYDNAHAVNAARTALEQAIRRAVDWGEPVAWVDVKDRDEGPYEFHGQRLLPVGRHSLYAKRKGQ